MWGYLFGNSKQKEQPKKAIVDLREHIQLLNKKQRYLETQIDQQEDQARKNLQRGNKTGAKGCLKKKKLYESQVEKLQSQVDSLEQQLYSIENANLNLETLKAMKQGASAMKQIHRGLDLDKVDDTMDEIRDQVELNQEISEAISKPLLMHEDLDEDELDEELAMLASEQAQKEPEAQRESSLKQGAIELPSVPDVSLSVGEGKEKDEEEEEDEDERALRELQAEMGL